jgi:hypothetical protein
MDAIFASENMHGPPGACIGYTWSGYRTGHPSCAPLPTFPPAARALPVPAFVCCLGAAFSGRRQERGKKTPTSTICIYRPYYSPGVQGYTPRTSYSLSTPRIYLYFQSTRSILYFNMIINMIRLANTQTESQH